MGKISPRSFALTSMLFYMSNAYVLGSNADAGRDDWLCALIASAAAFIPICILAALAEKNPEMDLFSIIEKKFGRILLHIFAGIYTVYAVLLLSMSLSIFSRYICTCVLLETPKAVMAFFLSVCVVLFTTKQGLSIGRTASMLFPIIIALIITIFAASAATIKLDRLMPIAENNILPGIYRSLAFPFFEPVILFSLLPMVKGGTKKRHWLIPYAVSSLILVFNIVRNTSVLGPALSGLLTFPTMHTDGIIDYESLAQRLEVLTTMIPASTGIIEAAIVALFSRQALCRAFNIKKEMPAGIFTISLGFVLCLLLYSTDKALEMRTQIWPAVSFPLQIIIPVSALLYKRKAELPKGKIFLNSLKKTMK